MHDFNLEFTPFHKIKDMDLPTSEKLELVLTKLSKKNRDLMCDIWKQANVCDNLFTSYCFRDITILKPMIEIFLRENNVTVSEIRGLIIEHSGKVEFEVFDAQTDTCYSVDLFGSDNILMFNQILKQSAMGCVFYVDPKGRQKLNVIVSQEDKLNSDNPFSLLHLSNSNDTPEEDQMQRENAKFLHYVFSTYAHENASNPQLGELLSYFNGNPPESELTKNIQKRFEFVKNDNDLFLEFAFNFIGEFLNLP